MLRSRKKLLLIGIVLLLLVVYFKPFSRTEISVLHHLTEIQDDGVTYQICLVKNPPYLSSTLKEKIHAFNATNPVKGKYFHRLFIKEHDKVWFSAFTLQEDIDYESTEIITDDLDNADFLATSYFFLTYRGEKIRSTSVNTGEYYYYKE